MTHGDAERPESSAGHLWRHPPHHGSGAESRAEDGLIVEERSQYFGRTATAPAHERGGSTWVLCAEEPEAAHRRRLGCGLENESQGRDRLLSEAAVRIGLLGIEQTQCIDRPLDVVEDGPRRSLCAVGVRPGDTQLAWVHVEVAKTMLGQPQFLHHGRGAEREVIAVADVDRDPGKRLARRAAADTVAGLEEQCSHPGPGEVGRTDEPVVPGPHDDGVEVSHGGNQHTETSSTFCPLASVLLVDSLGSDLRVDVSRLIERINALGEVGRVDGVHGEWGNARLALSDEDRDGRNLVATWMRDLGMEIGVDRVGNVVATWPGTDERLAPVMMGSHIDTVRTGGRFDGNLGVLAGLEVVEVLQTARVRPRRGLQVAFFTDEEGARFPPDMLGSLVYVGGMALETALDARDSSGARLGDELSRIGYAGSLPCPAASFPSAFVELHIEQGPVLEDEGLTIGAVTGVQGISWIEVTITGQSAHAGTTPMRLRRDPMVVAARIIAEARMIAHRLGGSQVATTGRVDVFPNLVNVVPARVTFTLDVRNTDERILQEVEQTLSSFARRMAADEGCEITMTPLARFEPVEFDPEMIELVESAARRLGYSCRRMPSGAGHDAQMLARVCPTAMVFVPSINGLSHNLAENTAPADLEAGANVLLQVVLDLASR